jgi:branched-chain amino acid transport system substrate-binding protein
VENQKVVAFIANMTILTLSSSLQYLEGKRIPTIGGDTTNVLWNQSPMLFPQSTSINELIKAVPRTAVADGAKKFGLLYCIEAEVCRNVNKVLWDDNGTTEVGAEKTFNAQVSITQPDFTSECLQMQSRGVQAVFAATDGATAIRIAQSCARQGFKPRYYIASLVVIEGQAQVKELDGTRAPVGNFPWMASAGAAGEYAQAMAKFAPGLTNSQGTSAAWVSGKVIEKAAAKIAAGAQPTSDAILRGLWTVKNDTFGGLAPPLTFIENKPAPEARCYFYVELAGGKWASKSGMKQTCP